MAHVVAVLHPDIASVGGYHVSAGTFSFDESPRISPQMLPEHAHRFVESDRLSIGNKQTMVVLPHAASALLVGLYQQFDTPE
jgi:hypothetical protein